MPPGIYVYRKVGPRLLPKTEHDTKQTKEGEPRKHGLILSHGEVESKMSRLLARPSATHRSARHDGLVEEKYTDGGQDDIACGAARAHRVGDPFPPTHTIPSPRNAWDRVRSAMISIRSHFLWVRYAHGLVLDPNYWLPSIRVEPIGVESTINACKREHYP